jgi:hypothetical protein
MAFFPIVGYTRNHGLLRLNVYTEKGNGYSRLTIANVLTTDVHLRGLMQILKLLNILEKNKIVRANQ